MNGAMKPPLAASTCIEMFFPVFSSYSSDISKSLPLVHSDQCTCYHDYHVLESAFIHVGEDVTYKAVLGRKIYGYTDLQTYLTTRKAISNRKEEFREVPY